MWRKDCRRSWYEMWSEVHIISLNVFDFLLNGDFSLWIVLYYSVPQHWFLFPIFVFLSETVISCNRLCSVFPWTLRFLTSQEVGRILSVKAFTLHEVGHHLTGLGLNKTMRRPQALCKMNHNFLLYFSAFF